MFTINLYKYVYIFDNENQRAGDRCWLQFLIFSRGVSHGGIGAEIVVFLPEIESIGYKDGEHNGPRNPRTSFIRRIIVVQP